MSRFRSDVGTAILMCAGIAGAFLACGGSAPQPASPSAPSAETPSAAPEAKPASPPMIPHDLAGKDDCTSCHKVGEGVKPMPESHKGRDNSMCQGCHQPKSG